jgi:hypothetical protein
LAGDVNSGLSDRFRRLLTGLWEDLRSLDGRIRELDREIAAIAASDPVAGRLQQLRGVGPMVATALIATVGNARQFASGRQMAASLGLTPRQNSSGGKERLLGISKRGDAYVRCLLIHGARAMIQMARRRADALSLWVMRIAGNRHPNVAAVALENKTARIAWAMITRETDYRPELHPKKRIRPAHFFPPPPPGPDPICRDCSDGFVKPAPSPHPERANSGLCEQPSALRDSRRQAARRRQTV